MYNPQSFRIDDHELLSDFMRTYNFATIVTSGEDVMQATHVPILYESDGTGNGRLLTHIARANPQVRDFETDREVLVIFSGPHAYVSPAWYVTHPAVPTWNYTAVHAYGSARLVDSPGRLQEILHQLIEFYEKDRTNRWDGILPSEFLEEMMKAIIGIEITIHRLEGKFKLSQTRPNDIPGVIHNLAASKHPMDREVAIMMEDHLKHSTKE